MNKEIKNMCCEECVEKTKCENCTICNVLTENVRRTRENINSFRNLLEESLLFYGGMLGRGLIGEEAGQEVLFVLEHLYTDYDDLFPNKMNYKA